MNEREQFEKYMGKKLPNSMVKELHWEIWQAARASQPAQEPVAEVRWRNGEQIIKFHRELEAGTKLFTNPQSEAARIAELEEIIEMNSNEKIDDRVKELEAQVEIMEEALEHLAKLGNEPLYGTSEGNTIAKIALTRAGRV